MIEISLTTALIVYSVILGAGAFGLWFYTEISVRRRFFELGNQYVWRCAICTYVYLDDEATTMSTCPRCQSINTTADRHAKLVLSRSDLAEVPAGPQEEGEEPRRNASKQKRKGARRRGPRKRGR